MRCWLKAKGKRLKAARRAAHIHDGTVFQTGVSRLYDPYRGLCPRLLSLRSVQPSRLALLITLYTLHSTLYSLNYTHAPTAPSCLCLFIAIKVLARRVVACIERKYLGARSQVFSLNTSNKGDSPNLDGVDEGFCHVTPMPATRATAPTLMVWMKVFVT